MPPQLRDIADTVVRHIMLEHGLARPTFLWETREDQQILRLQGHAGPVSVVFSEWEIEQLAVDEVCIERFILAVQRALGDEVP